MIVTRLLCAFAILALSAGIADAKPAKSGLHARAHHAQKIRARHATPAPVRDPNAAYWNDPGRNQFPSWGLTGN